MRLASAQSAEAVFVGPAPMCSLPGGSNAAAPTLVAAMLFSLVGAIVWVKLFDFLARHQVLNQARPQQSSRKPPKSL